MAGLEEVKALRDGILKAVDEAEDLASLRSLREKETSRRSRLGLLLSSIRSLPPEERAAFGEAVNEAGKAVRVVFEKKRKELEERAVREKIRKETLDITLPGVNCRAGGINPYFLVEDEAIRIFVSMGYSVIEGPDVETDYYNFERMNIPKDHPAREMQDTFYITENLLLRTHTSPGQAHAMDAAHGAPLKIICPGKVYRRDDDDLTHSHQFGQIEGLVIDKGISLADLRGTLEVFVRKMFGKNRKIRFRGSYFPFTEPSVEVDISCMECGGKGCPTCKGTGYIEILGAGMVHPNVLRMSGYDPDVYSGFAFGLGIERVAMLRYGIGDIRRFFQGDVRFLRQWKEGR